MTQQQHTSTHPQNRCPWSEHDAHTRTRPEVLKDSTVRHIQEQIAAHHFRTLPFLGITKKLFRCKDCSAVWAGNSIFERVSQDAVCGVYDYSLVWKPFPWVE